MPKISIVTQTKNNERTLERCIHSVLSQTGHDIEFTIIDQGSCDRSLQIIKKYEKYLSNWEVLDGSRTYEAATLGFHSTCGMIMNWLDPNAVIFKDGLDKVVDAFRSNPRVAWITGLPSAIDSDGEVFWSYSRLPLHSRATVCFTNWEDPWIFPETTFWSRALWNIAGARFDPKFIDAGELDLWRRFFRFAQLYSVQALIAGAERNFALHSRINGFRYYLEANRIMAEEESLIRVGEFPDVIPPPAPIVLSGRCGSYSSSQSSSRQKLASMESSRIP